MDETRMRLTEQERKERNEQLQRTMMLVVHACSCNNPQCQSTSCRKVRELFAHAMSCKLKVSEAKAEASRRWPFAGAAAQWRAGRPRPCPRLAAGLGRHTSQAKPHFNSKHALRRYSPHCRVCEQSAGAGSLRGSLPPPFSSHGKPCASSQARSAAPEP
eukprot:350767-Chlamydomonas_euryale.AAC.8